MKIRHYLAIKRRVEEIRVHASNFHRGGGTGPLADEIREDGQRMLDLCGYIDELCELIEKEEKDEDQ